jgi:hypothetical protein
LAPSGAVVDAGVTAVTDSQGWFGVSKLAPGEYVVEVQRSDSHLSLAAGSGDGFKIAAGEGVDVGELRVTAAGSVRGRIVDDAGIVVAGLQVIGFQRGSEGWEGVSSGVTDASGWFEIGGLEPEETLVWVQGDGRYRSVYFGGSFFEEDATQVRAVSGRPVEIGPIPVEVGAAVAGSVVDQAGAPLANVMVTAALRLPGGQWSVEAGAQTGPDGSYAIGGLPAGEFLLSFSEFSAEPVNARAETIVKVGDGTLKVPSVILEVSR